MAVQLPTEVRWHGRGGQGVVTASRLLAAAALKAGLFPQSLPDFGAERSGAPIAAYTRIGNEPPTLRGPVTNPAAVLVLDPTLIGMVDVVGGLAPGGPAVINTERAPQEVAARLGISAAVVCTVDGNGIANRRLGRPLPNAALLGALARVFPVVEMATLSATLHEQLGAVFPERVVQGNLAALQEGYESARVGEEG